jgi:hypothetical protein
MTTYIPFETALFSIGVWLMLRWLIGMLESVVMQQSICQRSGRGVRTPTPKVTPVAVAIAMRN